MQFLGERDISRVRNHMIMILCNFYMIYFARNYLNGSGSGYRYDNSFIFLFSLLLYQDGRKHWDFGFLLFYYEDSELRRVTLLLADSTISN